jgi:hypothetical protein
MADIVERLRFDAIRSEVQFSKGVASNIDEAANEIERLRNLVERLGAALNDISRQMVSDEHMAEYGVDYETDYQGGYDAIIKIARDAVALPSTERQS